MSVHATVWWKGWCGSLVVVFAFAAGSAVANMGGGAMLSTGVTGEWGLWSERTWDPGGVGEYEPVYVGWAHSSAGITPGDYLDNDMTSGAATPDKPFTSAGVNAPHGSAWAATYNPVPFDPGNYTGLSIMEMAGWSINETAMQADSSGYVQTAGYTPVSDQEVTFSLDFMYDVDLTESLGMDAVILAWVSFTEYAPELPWLPPESQYTGELLLDERPEWAQGNLGAEYMPYWPDELYRMIRIDPGEHEHGMESLSWTVDVEVGDPLLVNGYMATAGLYVGTTDQFEAWLVERLGPVHVVPEPSSFMLLGAGLAGLAAVRARRRVEGAVSR